MARMTRVLAPVLFALAVVGCDTSKRFSAAALPLARDIHGDLANFASPGTVTQATVDRALDMAAAAEVGNREAVAVVWYGDPPLRDTYTAWVKTEPKLAGGPGSPGESVRVIKLRTVPQMDFVLSIGQPKPPTQ